MITFCQIWQAEKGFIFVSMYRVAVFVHLKNIENLLFLACPFFGKTFFLEIRYPDFGTCFSPFLQFLSKIGCFMSLFRQNLFSENKKPRFWDMIRPILPPFCPLRGHPPKMAKVIFRKQETPILGHAFSPTHFTPRPRPSPENGKTFFRKTRMPQKETLIICQNVNNI
jgi:hypothetical protein